MCTNPADAMHAALQQHQHQHHSQAPNKDSGPASATSHVPAPDADTVSGSHARNPEDQSVQGIPDARDVIASQYSNAAAAHVDVSLPERRGFHTAHVRYVNNFVKAATMEGGVRAVSAVSAVSAASGIVVVDVACGRGQDVAKLAHAGVPLAAYYGMDIAPESVVTATKLAEHYLGARFPGAAIDVRVGDMATPGAWAHIPDACADIVWCQLALHYLFDAPEHARAFMTQVNRVLKSDSGLLVTSFVDGRGIVRRGRDGLVFPAAPGRDVVVDERYFSFTIPSTVLTSVATGPAAWYGNRYVFRMAGSVQDVPEFLTDEAEVARLAREVGGLTGGAISMAFDAAAVTYMRTPHLAHIAGLMDVPDAAWTDADCGSAVSLYRLALFSRDAGVLRAWSAWMASGSM